MTRNCGLGLAGLLLSGCAGDAPPSRSDGVEAALAVPVVQASDVDALRAALQGPSPVRIELAAGRYPMGTLTISGRRFQVVGAGASQTVLEGPVTFVDCEDCVLEGVAVVAGANQTGTLVGLTNGATTIRDVRVGSAGDGVAVAVTSIRTDLTLERVWTAGRTVAVRTEEGGRLEIRHSVFEDLGSAIEVHATTEVSLIDNLFGGIEGCLVRDTASARQMPVNAVFGNVLVGSAGRSATATDQCLVVPTLTPEDEDATPVLLELSRGEALQGSASLTALGRRNEPGSS